MKRRLLPQRLALPSAREAHGGDVDGRVSGEYHNRRDRILCDMSQIILTLMCQESRAFAVGIVFPRTTTVICQTVITEFTE